MKRRLIIFTLVLLSVFLNHVLLHAQITVADSSLLGRPLAQIEIVGNHVTHRDIILREMATKVGKPVTLRRLSADYYNVEDLNLFHRVEFTLTSQEQKVILVIKVTEKWYIFPEPYWFIKHSESAEVIYGIRYRHKNFRGENETLLFNLWGGADRGLSLYHNTPWMRGTPELSRTVEFYQLTQLSQKRELLDQDLEERHSRGTLLVGKRWNLKFSTDLGIRFRLIKGVDPNQTASHGSIDRLLDIMAILTWDTRDLRIFPRRGALLQTTYMNSQNLINHEHYHRWILETRGYLPYKSWSLAGRLVWTFGTGDIPQYDWYYVRETNPVRSSRIYDEGPFSYLLSGEIRLDLLKTRYFTWHQAPFLRQYFKDLPYGLAASFFWDAGDVYQHARETSIPSLLHGYGIGLLPLLPYVDVVRIEASFNPAYSWEAVQYSVNTGISF